MSPTSCRCSTPHRHSSAPPECAPLVAYDRDMAAELLPFLAAGLVVAFAALWPAARLAAADGPRSAIVAYYGILVGLGMAALMVRVGLRVLLPAVVIAYLAPFVLVRIRRLSGR